MEEQVQVEALPIGVEVQTEGPVWCRLTDLSTVVTGNLVIAVGIYEDQVARIRAGTVFGIVGIGLCLVLQHACRLITIEVGEGHAVLGTYATIAEL